MNKICIKCHKENDNINVICECGSQYFINGKDFNIKDNDIFCKCGCDFDKAKTIENSKKLIVHEYVCSSCGNKISIEKNIGTLVNAIKMLDL